MAEQEGRLAVDEAGHEIYYRLFGEGPETLVGLHGGPGADHRYLARLGDACISSTGNHRATAASGARTIRSISRSCSTTWRWRRK